jgi:flagellar basal body-associated protein FliL
MKTYEHELAHLYEHRKSVFRFSSASLLQSLITASVIGLVVTFIGVALNAVRWHGNTSWYVSSMAAAVMEMVIVTALVTIVLEQRRKRAIRRTLELAFLNHHIRNAITQMSMLQYVPDPQQHERLVREAVGRISEALFRIANSADLTGLSLEVDLKGTQLTHEGEAREQGEGRKAS